MTRREQMVRGVHGRVSHGGGLNRVTGDHGEGGELGEANRPRAIVATSVPGSCCREPVGGLAGVAAHYCQVSQGLPGELGVARIGVADQERRLIFRGGVREVLIGGADGSQCLVDPG